MSLTIRILIGLAIGLGAGMVFGRVDPTWLPQVTTVAEAVGGLWLDALRMTVVPLVFALIVTGVAAAGDAASAGGVTGRALVLFAVFLLVSALFGALAAPALLALVPLPDGAREALTAGLAGVSGPAVTVPPGAEWVRQLIPANPIAAAAEGAMLPLVLFALVFGFAATRIGAEPRRRMVSFFSALVDTMLVIVHWVLIAAPLGVLALGFLVGARAGIGAAGALGHYVLLISALCIGVMLIVYAAIAVARKVPTADFVRAAAPAQLIAFSTQSSLASLPAMVEGARSHLKVPERSANLVLPLAVSLFRITSPAANLGIALYLAHLYGIELSLVDVASGVVVAAVVSLASVGLPSQVSFFSVVAPVCIAVGAPIEMLGLLLAVETVPDIFRTVGNVTGDVAVAGLVDRASPVARGTE